ncbi:MAG: DUF4276 family protein [Pseudoclavibacter sp.]
MPSDEDYVFHLGAIVEGHGEVEALPKLIFKVAGHFSIKPQILIYKRPLRIQRSRFDQKFSDFERALQLLAPSCQGILVVLDTDDSDPSELQRSLQDRAFKCVGDTPTRVVPAVREYEAWILASLNSLRGKLSIPVDTVKPDNPEAIRGAKELLRKLTTDNVYSETVDQARYSSLINVAEALASSPSFGNFCDAVRHLTGNL